MRGCWIDHKVAGVELRLVAAFDAVICMGKLKAGFVTASDSLMSDRRRAKFSNEYGLC